TTPLKKEVLEEMKPYLRSSFANASSIHSFGREARRGVDEAREKVARFLNCNPLEIIFTSGGTEANNLAIKGVIFSNKALSNKALSNRALSNRAISKQKYELPHIITSQIEHHSVLDTCQWLEKMGFAEVSYLPVGKTGIVKIEDVKKALKKSAGRRTVLVSIMYANNEIGTIQPVREIGKLVEKINRSFKPSVFRPPSSVFCPILFHTDAVQAPEYLNCDVKYLHIDMLSLSAHKFGGPKGVGVLYVKRGVDLEPQMSGGAQEWGMRAGTENVAAIAGTGTAIATINPAAERSGLQPQRRSKQQSTINKIKKLNDHLVDGVLKKIPEAILSGERENNAPHIANFCFKGVKTDAFLTALDLEGIAASSGSACVSGSVGLSHVIKALKVPENYGCAR
ncbi:cysteine desulfurase, partial [Candidatus Berkelbacteria bacterium]|nr:cysteine desulfurase [Candidatus Berkelbacteria bacterium]